MKTDGTKQNVKITELLVTEALERKPGDWAGPGDIVALAGFPGHHDRRDPRRRREPGRATPDQGGRAGDLDDDRDQHLAARRPRPDQEHQGHRAPGQGPARQGAGRQRLAEDPRHRASRRLGGPGARRAGAGDPGRADAS